MRKPLKIKDLRIFFVYRKNSFVIVRTSNSRKLRWNQHTGTISAGRLKTVDGQRFLKRERPQQQPFHHYSNGIQSLHHVPPHQVQVVMSICLLQKKQFNVNLEYMTVSGIISQSMWFPLMNLT